MLKAKKIDAASGADALAQFMSDYTSGMEVFPIALGALDDAPEAWNFFRRLDDDKFFELVNSIEEKGLLSPLIVWEQPGGRYMILSGHNRRRALELLYEKTGEERFARAHCIVKKPGALSDEEARGVLVDANWVQRSLSTSERAKSILFKYAALGRKKRDGDMPGRTYDRVATHFGLKATQIYQYIRLASLEEHWLRCIDSGELSIKSGVLLADQSPFQREALWRSGCTTTKAVRAWQKTLESQRQTEVSGDAPMRELTLFVPAHRYNDVRELVLEYLRRAAEEEGSDTGM